MASATTSTHVSESSTPVACATDRARSTSVDVLTSLKETATGRNVLDECGICGGDGIPAGTATATETSSTPSENAALVKPMRRDGICDDVDPCVGELDACGVCNGPGASTSADALTSLKEMRLRRKRPTSAASVAATASLLETATVTETSLTPSENAEAL